MRAERFKVSEVKIRLADRSEDGVIGWASCVVDDSIFLDDIIIKKDVDERFFLTFPSKKSRKNSRYYHYFRPISIEAAEILEKAIIAKLKPATNKED